MDLVPRLFVNVRERLVLFHHAQTATDFVFGISAIGLVLYSAYRLFSR
jgi:hypothetical protein